MTLDALYDIAESEAVEICRFPMPETVSCSFPQGIVAIDKAVYMPARDEKVYLAHELGHCITGSFYNQYTKLDIRQQHENHANRWAYRQLLPYEELMASVFDGCTEVWQIAEEFDLPCEFVAQAVEYYQSQDESAWIA